MISKVLSFHLCIFLFVFSAYRADSQVIFSENWASSSFATNGWTFPSGQGNWMFNPTPTNVPVGATAPVAAFNWTPTLYSYSHELVSPIINATAYSGGSVFLSYKLALYNYGLTTIEGFDVEYKPVSSASWFTLATYSSASVAPGAFFTWTPTNVILPAMAGQNFQIRFRAYGPNSYWIWSWAVDDIEVLALNPCTGVPVAGTATAAPTNPCPGVGVTLNLTGNTLAGGLAYQWQVSYVSPTGPWVNIGTSLPLIVTPPAGSTSWYRCIVTCTTNGFTNTSASSPAVVIQPYSPTSSCYCTPTHLITSSPCINNVTYGSLNNSTVCTGTSGYNMYTTPVPNIIMGVPTPITITCSSAAITSVWIDFNHDATFSSAEWFQPYLNATTGSYSITVPPSALVGQTRMRVRSNNPSYNNAAGDACVQMTYGETEDYVINILPAGPHDPTITAVGAPIGNTCTDSLVTLTATVCNYGSANITTSPLVKVAVQYRVTGPLGTTYYNDTLPNGVLLGAYGATCQTSTKGPVNMFNGGTYSINAKVTIVSTPPAPSIGNAFPANDSLNNPIIITNYRPTAGAPYALCQYSTIPFGQGLTVGGCSAPIYDSVEINFTVTTSGLIDNVGATTTGTTQGPGNANCNNLYAGNLANALIPALPPGAYFTQPAKLSVSNLSSGFPTECRFILYKNTPSVASNLISACPLGYNTGAGDINVGGLSTGPASCFVNNRNIPVGDVSAIFANPPGSPLNVGYWETWNDLTTTSDVTFNACGSTQVKLKIYYAYVPPAFAWFDVPTGGSSLYSLSPFNPLTTPNALVNNSNTPGSFTFYAACLGLTGCRVPVKLNINPTPAAFQDTLITCEYAVSANNAIFDLSTLNSSVSGGTPGVAVDYYYDQIILSQIPNPPVDTFSSGVVYSKVYYPATGCSSSDTVMLEVSSIPEFIPASIYQGFACAPNSINLASVIGVSSLNAVDTFYYDNPSYTIPYTGNPYAISTADTVYMIIKTANSAACADSAVAYIDVLPATSLIANQAVGNYSSCGSVPCGVINLTDGNTETLYTTTDCRRIATVKDSTDAISLGAVSICQEIDCTQGTYNGQPYVNRHYEITPTNNGKAVVCLYFLDDDFVSYNSAAFPDWQMNLASLNNLCITQIDNGVLGAPGSIATAIPNSSITTSYDAATTIWTVCFPVDSFSSFYCHTCNPLNAALPVNLLSFTGQAVNGASELNWITSTEQHNSHFVVERSLNAKDFTTLSAPIPTKAPGGNSQTKLNYTYTDAAPFNGHNYYRLRQVDINGQVTYSKTVDLFYGNDAMVTLYPNPVNAELNVEINSLREGIATMRITDATGRTVRTIALSLQSGKNVTEVDMSALTDGVYMVHISDANGLNFSQLIRKK